MINGKAKIIRIQKKLTELGCKYLPPGSALCGCQRNFFAHACGQQQHFRTRLERMHVLNFVFFLLQTGDSLAEERKYSIVDLYKGSGIRLVTLKVSFNW